MGGKLPQSRRILPAAILIALGLSLLAGNVFSFDVVDNLWPVVLIALGLLWTIRGPLWLGAVSIVAGAIFLAQEFGAPVSMETAWPLLIVAVGVAILFSRNGRSAKRTQLPGGSRGRVTDVSDEIDISVSFSNRTVAIPSMEFRGGKVSASFGSVDLDLRQTQLHENGADLEISSTFGGITLHVPTTWAIQQNGSATMGGVDDVRSSHPTEGPTLRLRASTVLGNVTIED